VEEVPSAAHCTASETGLTITFTEGEDTGTLKTDGYALVSFVVTGDGAKMTETVKYEAQTVTDIPAAQRIHPTAWSKASYSALQRNEFLTWGKDTAVRAKRLAAKLNRSVRPSDVQAAARKWPLDGISRINLSTGVLATMLEKDAYTDLRLKVRLTVSDRTVKVAHNW
jgi:hypothetical protein